MMTFATIGFAAHVVSASTPYQDLEGPVIGTRVGICHINNLTDKVQLSTDGLIKCDDTVSPQMQLSSASTAEDLSDGYRVILYKLPHGAVEHSNGEDAPSLQRDMVATIPKSEKSALIGALLSHESQCFPVGDEMFDIPEDSVVPDASQHPGPESSGPQDISLVDEHEMPGEHMHDEDATPLSDDEEMEVNDPLWYPSKQQLVDLKIAHDNAGHPTASDFARLIKLGNGRPEVYKWVKKNFRCDDCEAHRKPKAKRPSAVPKTYRFNHVVGIDLVQTAGPDGVKYFFLNIICWGTSYQQVKIVEGDNAKTAENVWNTIVDTWFRIFGCPDILVLDPGLEFEGYFAEHAQAYGITILPTDRESPWQNGRTERAGGLWKTQLKIATRKFTPVDLPEWLALGSMCVQSRNRYFNRSGYSPMQRVFGTTQRLPGSLLSDDPIDPELLSTNPIADYQRAEEMRVAATRAWAALDSRRRLKRSLKSRHRIANNFTEGQLVFVWRQPRVGPGAWKGPGLCMMPTAGGCWVNMRGSLWRCANEQCRPATNDENLGAELVNRFLGDLRWDFQRNKGPKKFVDVRSEGIPHFPGERDAEADAGEDSDPDDVHCRS